MEIVVKDVFGHRQDGDGSVTFFVDVELDGPCQLRFTGAVAAQGLKTIIQDGIRALRISRMGR